MTGILKQWRLLPPSCGSPTLQAGTSTAVRGGNGCATTKPEKKKTKQNIFVSTDQLGLFLCLFCSFLRFLLLFLQAFLWRSLLLLRRSPETGRGAQHKHSGQLPPSISPRGPTGSCWPPGKINSEPSPHRAFKSAQPLTPLLRPVWMERWESGEW